MMTKKYMQKQWLLFLVFSLLFLFSGCGVNDAPQRDNSPSPKENQIIFKTDSSLSKISNMSAKLEIVGVGTYDMTVNADDTITATVPSISVGNYEFKITYYQGSVKLAEASTTYDVKAGSNNIDFTSSNLNSNFDDDNDGTTNLDEVKASTDPNNAPPDGTIDSPTGAVTIPQGQSVNFMGTGTDSENNTPLTYLWDFDGGATNSTQEDPGNVTFNTIGTYTVTFTVTDSLSQADPTPATVNINVKAGWTVIKSGDNHTVALKSDGTLWAWGRNGNGQLGDGTNGDGTDKNIPTQIGTDTDWAVITAGSSHTVALKSNGTLWAWGYNWYGQLGDGTNEDGTDKNIPTQIGTDTDWATITAGNLHTVALKSDGTLWAWGYNGNGQLGDGTNGSGTDKNIPTQIGTDTDWAAITAGSSHTVALKSDGSLWAWGYNWNGQLGDGTNGAGTDKNIPTQIGTDTDWAAITARSNHTVAMKNDSTLWAWGYNWNGQLGDGTNGAGTDKNIPTQIGTDTDWAAITAGSNHTVAMKNDGTLWAWGYNGNGQLGDGTTTNKNVPTQIGTDTDWAAITAGGSHTVALKNDGTLWVWGFNFYGQLGNGTTANNNIPTQIGANTDWAAITAGDNHTVALKNDGTLWAWGRNGNGQLGDGTNGSGTNKNIPTQIGTDTDWAVITAGSSHTVALKSNGTLWAWGYNWYGQLGDGTNGDGTDKNIPTQIGTDTDWTEITVSSAHTVAMKSNGSLWTWGRNYYGQLGDGTNGSGTDKNIPTQIGADTDWAAITVGNSYTVALKSNGTLWAWGYNWYGQLGDGTNGSGTDKNIPTQIGTDTDWAAIIAGSSHTVALKSSFTLLSWGYNWYGQLGDGTAWKETPVQIND